MNHSMLDGAPAESFAHNDTARDIDDGSGDRSVSDAPSEDA
ncbi:hypothetical protein [Kitasatospora indigofera]